VFLLLLILAVVLFAATLGLLQAFLAHRTDLRPGQSPYSGPSWSWQINVFLEAEYDARGRLLRRWWAAAMLAFLAVIIALVRAWP
jgi:hypothetical protein